MKKYIADALFIHTKETAALIDPLRRHACNAAISPVLIDDLMADAKTYLADSKHVVVAGTRATIKSVLHFAMEYGFSVGIIPTANQKNLIRFYDLPDTRDAAIDLALRANPMLVDIVLCNQHIVLFKATAGNLPLLDAAPDASRLSILWAAFKQLFKIELLKYNFVTSRDRRITTAASGCMILQHHKGSVAARMIAGDSCIADGSVSTVISAPISIIDYLKFILSVVFPSLSNKSLPNAIGYLKVPGITIEPESVQDVFIDGEKLTQTPMHCEAKPAAVKLNVGQKLEDECMLIEAVNERIEINHLPKGKELVKAQRRKSIPLFSYASEERFHDLFSALRSDAEINGPYVVLMVLSTMLAAAGLYLDSASVIIGAMLLAPLMAPIVSLAMGLLRGIETMMTKSLVKIAVGIAIALAASVAITQLFPDKPVTGEMQARLNPTLLDLAVAIISGIAAAYSKSHKEIIQSLAGVAIAVALVPPLTVAGTGIGWGDYHFALQAFLLFSTNLIGIIVAAALTFRVLGFSPAIRSKWSLSIVGVALVLIAVPLYFSYGRIVEDRIIEKTWQKERFLVNDKYVIVEKADVLRRGDRKIIVMDVVARDVLNRSDLNELKRRIETNFSGKLIIHVKPIYIP